MKLPDWLTKLGLVGERKALALLCLGIYATLFSVMGLIALSQIPEWTACFFGLAACYAVGFFAVAADWFWGRWFAVGLGNSGLWMAVMAMATTRAIIPEMVIFGVMHGLVALCLMGEKMSAVYEARADWRERWKLDDDGVKKIRNSVTRAAASLPSLIMWALAPREGAAVAVLALGGVGLYGLLRGRTWGVLAIGGAGVAAAIPVLTTGITAEVSAATPFVPLSLCGAAAGALLITSAAPFVPGMLSHLTRRR